MKPIPLTIVLALALSGCSDQESMPPTPDVERLPPASDSPDFHDTYDLAGGLERSWLAEVAGSPSSRSLLRFSITGTGQTPLRLAGNLCFSYWQEQYTDSGAAESSGESGQCGGPGNLNVAPEVDLSGKTLFELAGMDVLPGWYRFEVSADAQAATLAVDLVPG